MARPEFGTKRVCAACNLKFYDLHQTPIVCPSCATVFVVPTPPPARPPRRPFPRPPPTRMAVPLIPEKAELPDDAIVDDAKIDRSDAPATEEESVGDKGDDAGVPAPKGMDEE